MNALSELAVRYMLTGSVRRDEASVRLTAELCDCESGTAIWSDRFACAAADLFDLQDELSVRVAATIAPQVQESELRRSRAKHPASLDAYECVLRGLDLLYRVEDDPWAQALPLFERAIALDPGYAAAYALAATATASASASGPDPTADSCLALDPGPALCEVGVIRIGRCWRRRPELAPGGFLAHHGARQ